MSKKKKVAKTFVIRLVKKHLDAVGHGIEFEIVEAGVRTDGDWWQAPVLSSLRGHNVNGDVTVNIFATIEDALHTTEQKAGQSPIASASTEAEVRLRHRQPTAFPQNSRRI